MDFNERMNEYIRIVNNALLERIPAAQNGQKDVVKAMKYSVSNGGKRLRPIFVLEFCNVCGGDTKDALDFACAIEFIHTYSLIHDDLPCMDDDDMRRGNPSCHKMYGEATALLAGDALLTHAFELVAGADLPDKIIAQATMLLAQNAGVGGMIGGQVLDLLYEEKVEPTLSEVIDVYRMKTGALISASCLLGCLAAGADDEKLSAASKFAYNIGVAFQIQDDILDIEGDEAVIGKPVGSDESNDKSTYVTMVGIERAKKDIERLTANAISYLDAFDESEFLKQLAVSLVRRNK